MTTLQQIIQEIKTVALASGFKFVSENKVNQNDISDTLLPAMYIKMSEIPFDKFRINVVEETYNFSLLIVIGCSENPLSDLKTIQDTFLSNFTDSTVLKEYFLGEKINLVKSTITNDIELSKKLGGESCILEITIENINCF